MDLISLPPCSRHIENIMQEQSKLSPTFNLSQTFLTAGVCTKKKLSITLIFNYNFNFTKLKSYLAVDYLK